MEHVQAPDYLTSMSPFIKSRTNALQPVFRMTDFFDISFVVIQVGAKHLVDGTSVRKVVSFQHVDQKVDGRPTSLLLGEHLIERHPIAIEDLPDAVGSACLEIINQEKETVFGRNELTGR